MVILRDTKIRNLPRVRTVTEHETNVFSRLRRNHDGFRTATDQNSTTDRLPSSRKQ